MSARQALRALRTRFRPGPPEPGEGRFSALRSLDRLANFHRERAVESTSEAAFRLDRVDGPDADDVHWPLDHVEIAPGTACAMGQDCRCTEQMAKGCEWKTLSQAASAGPLYGWVEKILLGSIILLGVFAFAAGYSWGSV